MVKDALLARSSTAGCPAALRADCQIGKGGGRMPTGILPLFSVGFILRAWAQGGPSHKVGGVLDAVIDRCARPA